MIRHQIKLIVDDLLQNNKKTKLHISLKNRQFRNGIISNMYDEEEMSFIDDKLGHVSIKYSNIIDINLFKEK